MAPVTRACEACHGRRYGPQALAHTWGGRSIADVLQLTVDDALDVLADSAITDRLRPLHDVGIGHLTLGRPLGTLSGGERQRLKIAVRLAERTAVLVLDEPTTGLHPTDVDGLLALLDRLVDAGNTVIAVEHDLDVIRHADWVIDLGPDAGRQGGRIVFEGTPEQLCSTQDSHTAEHLRRATAD